MLPPQKSNADTSWSHQLYLPAHSKPSLSPLHSSPTWFLSPTQAAQQLGMIEIPRLDSWQFPAFPGPNHQAVHSCQHSCSLDNPRSGHHGDYVDGGNRGVGCSATGYFPTEWSARARTHTCEHQVELATEVSGHLTAQPLPLTSPHWVHLRSITPTPRKVFSLMSLYFRQPPLGRHLLSMASLNIF